MIPWMICGALFAAAFYLGIRLWLLRKALEEIRSGIDECLSQDTNVLISISTNDRYAKRLASSLNSHLRILRAQRRQFLNGDRDLKEAVTNISHDLRTPITAIRGYMDLLEREPKPAPVSRYLSLIANRVQAMTQLTEELFRYSTAASVPDQPDIAPVSLNSALEESAASFYAALIQRGITPDIKMPGFPIIRMLDKNALSRIFGNILNNALKYSGGDLEITLEESGKIIFSNTASALDEVQTGLLFNRYYTVSAANHSTGLGLAISRALVERMKGTMSAVYENGKLYVSVTFRE